MEITNEQLITLSNLRKDLIELYNNNHYRQEMFLSGKTITICSGIDYTMIRDLDQTIEEIIKK